MEPETDQKIRENRKLQKKAVSKDGPREAQKSGDRTDTADHVGDIFRFHEETLIKLRRLGNSLGSVAAGYFEILKYPDQRSFPDR